MLVGQMAMVQRARLSHPSVSLFLTDNVADEKRCLPLDDGTCVLLLERRDHYREGTDAVEFVEYRALVGDAIGWISSWNLREL